MERCARVYMKRASTVPTLAHQHPGALIDVGSCNHHVVRQCGPLEGMDDGRSGLQATRHHESGLSKAVAGIKNLSPEATRLKGRSKPVQGFEADSLRTSKGHRKSVVSVDFTP